MKKVLFFVLMIIAIGILSFFVWQNKSEKEANPPPLNDTIMNSSQLYTSTIENISNLTIYNSTKSASSLKDYVKPELTKEIIAEYRKKYNITTESGLTLDTLESLQSFIRYKYSAKILPDYKDNGTWKTTEETINSMTGDCEDWNIFIVAVLSQYSENNKCYVLAGDFSFSFHRDGIDYQNAKTMQDSCGTGLNHTAVICYFVNEYTDARRYYWLLPARTTYGPDSRQVYMKNNEDPLEKKSILRRIWADYVDFDYSRDRINVAFNSKEEIHFSNNEELLNWLIGL